MVVGTEISSPVSIPVWPAPAGAFVDRAAFTGIGKGDYRLPCGIAQAGYTAPACGLRLERVDYGKVVC